MRQQNVVSVFASKPANGNVFQHRLSMESLNIDVVEEGQDTEGVQELSSESGSEGGHSAPRPVAHQLSIEEVHQRLAELENLGSPTKEEIDALMAQYSDLSDGSEDSGDESGSDDEREDEVRKNNTRRETVIMKVVIVGNARCGKTSTIRRFVQKEFSEEYVSTIGADFVEKIIDYDETLRISLQLWDIAGQDRFAKLTRAYFRDTKGAIIVCDITRANTIDAVVTWKSELDACCTNLSETSESIPVVMIANKSDLLDDPLGALTIGVNMQKCVSSNGIIEWFRTSAKNGEHVDDAFKCLVDDMVQRHRASKKRRSSTCSSPTTSDHCVCGHEDHDKRTDIIRLSQAPPPREEEDSGPCDCN